MKTKRKHRFVVGFKEESQCIYGKDAFSEQCECDVASFTQPMTIFQAIRQLETLDGDKKGVYELVEVDPKKEKLKQKILNQMLIGKQRGKQ